MSVVATRVNSALGRPSRRHPQADPVAGGTPSRLVGFQPRDRCPPKVGIVREFDHLGPDGGGVREQRVPPPLVFGFRVDIGVGVDDDHVVLGGEARERLDEAGAAAGMKRDGHAAILHRGPRADCPGRVTIERTSRMSHPGAIAIDTKERDGPGRAAPCWFDAVRT